MKPKTPNEILKVENGIAYLHLPNNKYFLIDEIDLPLIQQYRWSINQHDQIFTPMNRYNCKKDTVCITTTMLSRFILDIHESCNEIIADHKDHNATNNTRANLRKVSLTDNQMNRINTKGSTSQYLGVYSIRDTESGRRWKAQINHNKCYHYLGSFYTEIEAAQAYDLKKYQLTKGNYGLNFPEMYQTMNN